MLAGVLEYASHAIVFSLLAAVTVELLLYAWRVQDPSVAIAFRLIVLAIPPVAPMLFAALSPGRDSEPFRQGVTLLNLRNWLGPEPSIFQPVWAVLLAAMVSTTILLAGLDVVGFLRRLRACRACSHQLLAQPPSRLPEVVRRLDARGLRLPPVLVAPQPGPTAFTAGLLHPSILVSPAIVELLDDEELEGVLAHEAAHVERQDNWLGWLTFALRIASFYNPVVQFTYHRIGHDVERVCDARAVVVTGKPLALASALIKVFRSSRSAAAESSGLSIVLNKRAVALENRARRTMVEDRAERLVYPKPARSTSFPCLRLALAAASVLGLAYMIV